MSEEFTAREHFDALPDWVQALWGVDSELAIKASKVMNENEELKNRVHELGAALMHIEDHFSHHSDVLCEADYRDMVKRIAKKEQEND